MKTQINRYSICDFQISNMAPSTGWRQSYSLCPFSTLTVLLIFVPLTNCMRLGMSMHRICVPHYTNPGYVVTKVFPDPQCLEMNHISKYSHKVTNPFNIRHDGYLVTNESMANRFGDIYIMKTKTSPHCNMHISPVLNTSQIHIEITGDYAPLHFVHDKYVGTIARDAKPETIVAGLKDLFACVGHHCDENIRYSLKGSGSEHFHLRTGNVYGQSSVQIRTKDPLHNLQEETLYLIISGEHSNGLEGHTNVEINIKENENSPTMSETYSLASIDQSFSDQNLRFEHHRQKRETPETYPPQTFPETKTGALFNVADPSQPDYEYNLESSTLQNMFQVSRNGQVSLASGAKFDYEDPDARSATLVISVVSQNVEVKKIQVEISITDVNDEDPEFTNKPSPYLAVARTPNTLIYTLTARDPDAGANLNIRGDLSQDEQQRFSVTFIPPDKAEIYTTSESIVQNQEYNLRIIAEDLAAPAGTQRATARVSVKTGDRAPQPMLPKYYVEFQEMNAVDQIITITPISAISFQGSPITYIILDSRNQPSDDFQVNADNHIFVRRVMDFENEADRQFDLVIRARESATNYITDIPLEIKVTDLNEHPPRFPASAYDKTYPENVPVNSSLLQVNATDKDANTTLSFSVDDDHFKVSSVIQTAGGATAVISVNKPLDFDRISPKIYDFSVIATDDGTVPMSGSSVVRIVVTDVNDEKPLFPVNETAGIYMTANIRYDVDVGDLVYTLQASDADSGDTVSYQLLPANQYGGLFDLNSNEGSITLAKKIATTQDQITQFQYELVVMATDDGGCCGGTPKLSSTGTVTINILTDNIHRPQFKKCDSYLPSVSENAVGVSVIQVSAEDADYGSNGEVTYSIREGQGSDNFRINATTGEVFTTKGIDREALVGTTTIAINILAVDGGGYEGTCPLLVKINDVNDEKPVFTPKEYTFNILNDLDENSVAFRVRATDADIGQNADLTYSFVTNPDEYFKFDEQTKLTGAVKVNKTLPDEERTITLVVQARDNGTRVQLSSTATVSVHIVRNQNELPPRWIGNDATYTKRYSEATELRTVLVQLRAQSQLDNKQLSYSIIGDDNIKSVFEVVTGDLEGEVTTGTLRNKKAMDYEVTTSYQITVRASDVNLAYADRVVTIEVEDANDIEPTFLGLDSGSGWLELTLKEGNYSGVAEPGERVAQIRATDLDRTAPFNRIQEYRIKNSDGTFYLEPTQGILYTRSSFDRESKPKDSQLVYSLIVEAIDSAPSSLPNTKPNHNTGQCTVKITITDVNDNPPAFPQASYTFSVEEDKLFGTTVDTVTADDPDSDAILTYSRQPAGPFNIQQTTGAIQVQGALDYDEGERQYNFTVIVSDQDHEGIANVTINILDVNDNPPKINNYDFLNFRENDASILGVIQVLNATDIDNGGQNTFYYSLKFTDDLDKQYFSIDEFSGALQIIKELDRDYPNGKEEFKITVEVADAPPDKKRLFGRGTVSVKPIDENDNTPFFPNDTAQMSVLENQTAVVQVGRVVVMDYDAGENAEVNISMLSQGPGDNFDFRDGYIFTKNILDREEEDTYFILMQAVDHGDPSLTGTGTLTISVGDINDNPPYFTQNYEFTISERSSGAIGRITAHDRDVGINAALTYSLDPADRTYFAMTNDNNQGVLEIFAAVDYDEVTASQRSFNLTAYAVDSNPGQSFENRAETRIHVIVTDYNDEVPKFDKAQESANVLENLADNGTLATFHATDRDINAPYNQFTYHIQQKSDPLNQFAIDQDGHVTLRYSLDREAQAIHIIHILAIDNPNSMPQNTGTATLTVTVMDVNDNYPDFAQSYSTSLMENQDYSNVVVTDFSAIDRDEPQNGPPFTFELVCSDAGASTQCSKFNLEFQQNLDSGNGMGTIRVTGTFDREFESVVRLPIKMCDTHSLCGIRYLDVKILDENDNTHEAGYQYILVNNFKGLYGGIPIGEVNVEDPDENNDDKTYKLVTSEAAVFVDVANNSGIITLKHNVPEMTFTFGVKVTDVSGRAKTSQVTVAVQYIPEDAVYSSGSIRIDGITDKDFLLRPKRAGSTSLDDSAYDKNMYEKFHELLAKKLSTDVKNVFIHSVMYDESKGDFTNVLYSAHGSPWYPSGRMNGVVTTSRDQFQAIIGSDGTIDMVPVDMCRFETCEGGCYNDLVVTDTPKLINTHGVSFVGVNTDIVGQCGCRATTFPKDIDCTPGYCYHGGTCVKDKWNVVSCECPEGFEGPRCQQLRISFNGTGYALNKPLEQCEESRTSIEILTSLPNGLILYNGPVAPLEQADPRDFILLELTNSKPRLRINHGTGELTLTIPGSKQLNDGAWHRIDIHRKKKEVSLVVDQCQDAVYGSDGEDRSNCEAKGVTPGENIYINVDTVLQLGGRSSTPSTSPPSSAPYPLNVMTERFNGCMKNLMHNAELYDLSTGGIFPGAADGCQREDDACSGSCGRGQCLITGPGTQICNCDPKYRTSQSTVCDTETTVRDFKNESYIDWRLKDDFMKLLSNRKTAVSFRYRTRDPDGLLFSVVDRFASSKYIKLKVAGGLLQATYNLGDSPITVSLSNVPASDGQWHQVRLERAGKELMLKMDSGEGRYYADSKGHGNLDLSIRQDEIHSGANLIYSSGQPSIFAGDEQDFISSCIEDIRLEHRWFPMKDGDVEETQSPAATVENIVHTDLECIRNDCPVGKCRPPLICIPLWETSICGCSDFHIRNGNQCDLKDFCENNPCVGSAVCSNLNPCKDGSSAECRLPFNSTKRYFSCQCSDKWYGDLCQCHPSLHSGGDACYLPPEPEPIFAANIGLILGIIFAVLFLIVMVLVIWFLIMRCQKEPEEKEPFDDDADDDIRENIMYYDEEGAGEEDQTAYDLSRLRKPDDGEHARPWDDPDLIVPKERSRPLNTSSDRPDIGDFINKRLDEADDDPNSPPYDTPIDFDFEGGNSSVGSLSSLNTSSSGDQDYDYLNEWGPKFAKLADMYNNYDDTE